MVKVIDKYTKTPQITIFDGLAINLVGDDILKVTPARGLSPRKEVVVKGATQAQLQKLYNEGHPILEEVADKPIDKVVDKAAPKGKKVEVVETIEVQKDIEVTDVADMSELHEEIGIEEEEE